MKNFKEYLGLPTIRVGGLDSIHPMTSLGKMDDRPPKGKGSRDSRAMGLQANYTSQGVGTMNPMLSTPTQPIKVKKEDLYSDDNPKDTVKGTGYGTAEKARATIKKMQSVDKTRAMQTINTMYNRAKHHANQNQGMRNAMKVFKSYIDKQKKD